MSEVQSPKSVAELFAIVQAQEVRIAELEKAIAAKKSDESTREMTDDDARRVLTGDLAATKHKDAAKALGLSYGQVYSCRLEFTFKNIHKEMKDQGKKNPWAK